jgi:hypothetical protein
LLRRVDRPAAPAQGPVFASLLAFVLAFLIVLGFGQLQPDPPAWPVSPAKPDLPVLVRVTVKPGDASTRTPGSPREPDESTQSSIGVQVRTANNGISDVGGLLRLDGTFPLKRPGPEDVICLAARGFKVVGPRTKKVQSADLMAKDVAGSWDCAVTPVRENDTELVFTLERIG